MAEKSVVRFRLTGALEGQTITLGSFRFEGGITEVVGDPTEVGALEHYLYRNWRAERVVENGTNAQGVEPDLPESKPKAAPSLTTRQLDDLIRAMKALNPEQDEFWTADGKPTLRSLEGAVKNLALTRRVVTEVWPEFNRELARQLAAAEPEPQPELKRE